MKHIRSERFFVDFSGTVSNTGRTFEGPLCVEVFFNPLQQFIGLQAATATVAGPDLSNVVLGGPVAGGLAAPQPRAPGPNLPVAFRKLFHDAKGLGENLSALQYTYEVVSQKQDQAINDIVVLRKKAELIDNPVKLSTTVIQGYAGLLNHLNAAIVASAQFIPSDQLNSKKEMLLLTAQGLEDRLSQLALDFPNGTEMNFNCVAPPAPPSAVSWSAWYAQCKDDVYTPLKAVLDANLQTAKTLTSDSDAVKTLKKKMSIVRYWDTRFASLGLTTDISDDQIPEDISPAFFEHRLIRCGTLFNQTANTTVSLVVADLTPTLDGSDPMVKTESGFVVVSCSTRFSISAGMGFNTIEQKEFAITKNSDGKGGVQNVFGVTNDSTLTPVALAMVHMRLVDSATHKVALHGSLGFGGSLTSPSASTALQFLPGISISFLRTVYLTFGSDIGTSNKLGGGFHEGDTVPSAITSMDGQTTTSHQARLGFAVTFTKP
jgi:hypothetical protein